MVGVSFLNEVDNAADAWALGVAEHLLLEIPKRAGQSKPRL
jgi:hypothetical protein